MMWLVIVLTALAASTLALFSGFGLGTLLLPAFALYLPLEVAITATAMVHLANNLFKLALVGRHASRTLVIRFGLPAIAGAAVGALVLAGLGSLPTIAEYDLVGTRHRIEWIGLAVGILMLTFAIVEAAPSILQLRVDKRWLPVGGLLSGFIGGLSGHQGALRSAFFLRFKHELTGKSFIGTGVVVGCLVDVGRLAIYAASFKWASFAEHAGVILAAMAASFVGAVLGYLYIEKVTLRAIQLIVAALLCAVAVGVGSGFFGNG